MPSPRKKVLVLTRITTFEQLNRARGKRVLAELARRGERWYERIEEAHSDNIAAQQQA